MLKEYDQVKAPKIICCKCLNQEHFSPNKVTVTVQNEFPDRIVFKSNSRDQARQWKCPECGNDTDVILFGEAFIGITSENREHQLVKENNLKYYLEQQGEIQLEALRQQEKEAQKELA